MEYFKTPGDFFHADVAYPKGHVFSNEDVDRLGIDRTSLIPANEQELKAQEIAAGEISADEDAELDTATAPLSSAPTDDTTGADTTSTSGDADKGTSANGEGSDKTLPHEVTQEDLDANPELVADGVKVGDVIHLPAIEKTVDQAWLDANPDVKKPDGSDFAIGETILVAEEAAPEA